MVYILRQNIQPGTSVITSKYSEVSDAQSPNQIRSNLRHLKWMSAHLRKSFYLIISQAPLGPVERIKSNPDLYISTSWEHSRCM